MGLPDLVEHRFSAFALGHPPEAGGDHGEEAGRLLAFVLEVMGKVSVEGDAVPLLQFVAAAVDDQRQGAGEDDGGLAAAGLVHRRVLAAAGAGAGVEHMQGDVGALTGQRRGQLLEAVSPALGVATTQRRG